MTRKTDEEPRCSNGIRCVAYPVLGEPAKLSRGNLGAAAAARRRGSKRDQGQVPDPQRQTVLLQRVQAVGLRPGQKAALANTSLTVQNSTYGMIDSLSTRKVVSTSPFLETRVKSSRARFASGKERLGYEPDELPDCSTPRRCESGRTQPVTMPSLSFRALLGPAGGAGAAT